MLKHCIILSTLLYFQKISKIVYFLVRLKFIAKTYFSCQRIYLTHRLAIFKSCLYLNTILNCPLSVNLRSKKLSPCSQPHHHHICNTRNKIMSVLLPCSRRRRRRHHQRARLEDKIVDLL